MTTGDPAWPCGHYCYPTDNHINKCPVCFPINFGNYRKLPQPNKQIMESTPKPWRNATNTYLALIELSREYKAKITTIHDEICAELPADTTDSRKKEFFDELDEITIKGIFTEAIKDWRSDPANISILPNPIHGVNTAGIQTGRMSCRNPSLSVPPRSMPTPLHEQFTEEDRAKNPDLASAIDSYYRQVLISFTEAQRASDIISPPDKDGRRLLRIGRAVEKSTKRRNLTPASEFMVVIPEASYVWSDALRAKIKESEAKDKEKKLIEDSRHWNPYPDIDD